jgi:hypothetical protein
MVPLGVIDGRVPAIDTWIFCAQVAGTRPGMTAM